MPLFISFRRFGEKVWTTTINIALFLSLYLSAFLYWAARRRSLGFLIGVNPGIRMGGTVGYSKFGLLRRLPASQTPHSILLWKEVSPAEVGEMMAENGLRFPVILKPDTGLQSMGVRKINSTAELAPYLRGIHRNLILQEFVKTEAEFAVLYYRLPNARHGRIFSFAQRMRGDDGLAGAECVSLNHLISQKLDRAFEDLSRSVEGFFFGRYDILADSVEAILRGEFMVVELNGANSMPLHLYDPRLPLARRRADFRDYWRILSAISAQNEASGAVKNGSVARYFYEMAAMMSARAAL